MDTLKNTISALDPQYWAVTIRVMAEMSFPSPFNLILLIAQASTHNHRANLDDVNWHLTDYDPTKHTQANSEHSKNGAKVIKEVLRLLGSDILETSVVAVEQ